METDETEVKFSQQCLMCSFVKPSQMDRNSQLKVRTNLKNSGFNLKEIKLYSVFEKFLKYHLHKTGNKVSLTKFIYPEDFESTNNGIEFTEDEINAVVETFKQAVADIKALNFEPTKNKDKACKYCNYKDYCGMNKL